jgi:hypothetical protein
LRISGGLRIAGLLPELTISPEAARRTLRGQGSLRLRQRLTKCRTRPLLRLRLLDLAHLRPIQRLSGILLKNRLPLVE